MAGKPGLPSNGCRNPLRVGLQLLAGFAGLSAVVALALMAVRRSSSSTSGPGRPGRAAGRLRRHLSGAPAVLPRSTARDHLELAGPLVGADVQCTRLRPIATACACSPHLSLGERPRSFFFGFIVRRGALRRLIAARFDRSGVVRWVLFGTASLCGFLLNPTASPALSSADHLGMEALPSIVEWQASTPQFSPFSTGPSSLD